MRIRSILMASGAALLPAAAAQAADQLKFGAAPSWVVEQAIPPPSDKVKDKPVALLLHDQQVLLEPGKISTFAELAFKIQKPEGLAAGNLSIAWNPAFDTATVNRLEIRRGNQVIDVLKSGQTFTTMRRESNLDLATLNGILTANIQPEGLQEGDIVVLATTTEHVDPTLKGHVETNFAPWGDAQIGLAHARITWPSNLDLKFQKVGDLPAPQLATRDGHKVYEITMRDVDPVIDPKGAPVRFKIGRLGEATDFRSWADAARLMAPLFREAAVIPPSGPLRDEMEKIRKASADPKVRAEQALQLVQQRVRYVALLMGQGGYVPAKAEETWSRRFGDCKAKTALLLAILHELGIQAEPVAANPILGDAIGGQLPAIGMFNHVLVRAHVGSKDYWLDGTRSGDASLERIKVPNFGWGLPLIDNAALVHIVPPPLDAPDTETRIDVDATAGVFAPAKVDIEQLVRGDGAVHLNQAYAQLSTEQRDQILHEDAKKYFDTITVESSSLQFDKATSELRVSTKGTAKIEWREGWHGVAFSSIGDNPDLDRPAGPQHDAPVANSYPDFNLRVITFKFPPGFAAGQKKLPPAVHETLSGVEYQRTITLAGNDVKIETSERSVAPEVAYKDALAAAPRLKALDKDDVYLNIPQTYRPTVQDAAALQGQTPQSAGEYFQRAGAYLAQNKMDDALADLNAGLALDPKSVWALIERAAIRMARHDNAAAVQDLDAAQAIEPDNVDLIRARAGLLQQKGDVAAAIEAYSKVLERNPGDRFARIQRGLLFYSDWKYDEAITDYSEFLKADPGNVFALGSRALAYFQKGNYAAADEDVASGLKLAPNNPSVLFVKAKLDLRRGSSDAEIDSLSKLIETGPDKGYAYVQRAHAYYRMGRYDAALADTDQALKLGYKGADLRVVRANIFMLRDQRDAVAAEADAMVRGNPDTYAYAAAAKTYAAIGQRQKAMQLFDRALAVKADGVIYVNRAQVRPYTDLDGRLADLDAALKLEPNNVDAIWAKASQLVLKGDYAGAIALYDRDAALEPDNAMVVLGRAEALYKSGRRAEAETLLNDRRTRIRSAGDFYALCWAEARANMFLETALGDCNKASELNPSTRTDGKAFVLLRLNRIDEAIAAFTAALALDRSAFNYLGRAFAWARKGDRARAEADRAEALKRNADEELQFAEYGLKFDDKPASTAAATKAATAGKN